MTMKWQVIAAILPMAQISCCFSNSNLKSSSKIPSRWCGSAQENCSALGDRVRASILGDCPVGSSRAVVADYAKKNFRKGPADPAGATFEFKINDMTVYPVGRNWLEVKFEFGAGDRLKNVEVECGSELWITA